MMKSNDVSPKDRKMAQVCVKCTVYSRARKNQQGMAYWFVRKIEGDLYPFCKPTSGFTAARPTNPSDE